MSANRVSMKDIASRLNISRCTVSNILCNRMEGKSYRRETIDTVLKTAEEMGYVSNNIAKSLKTGSTGTIAIVVPDIANPFYIKIIKEVERRANDEGYSLMICMAEEILAKENKALTMLQSRCVDGVLISPVSYSDSLARSYPFQIVCFDRTVKGERFAHVLIDNCASGRALAEKMLEDGARHILFLAGSREDLTVTERLKGLCDALRACNVPFDRQGCLYGIYDEETAYRAMLRVMDGGYAFDSVYLCTNYCIYGVLRALKERGITPISIGGFECFLGMDILGEDVHVVVQPEVEMARLAFDKLHSLLNEREIACSVLPTEIR